MSESQQAPQGHTEEPTGSACPSFVAAMDVIGRRWNGIIIEAIGRGNTGFADISRFVGGIGDTMLARRLKELETDCLIKREVVPDRPVRVHYTLTPAGQALLPILQDITNWGHTYTRVETAPVSNSAKQQEEEN